MAQARPLSSVGGSDLSGFSPNAFGDAAPGTTSSFGPLALPIAIGPGPSLDIAGLTIGPSGIGIDLGIFGAQTLIGFEGKPREADTLRAIGALEASRFPSTQELGQELARFERAGGVISTGNPTDRARLGTFVHQAVVGLESEGFTRQQAFNRISNAISHGTAIGRAPGGQVAHVGPGGGGGTSGGSGFQQLVSQPARRPGRDPFASPTMLSGLQPLTSPRVVPPPPAAPISPTFLNQRGPEPTFPVDQGQPVPHVDTSKPCPGCGDLRAQRSRVERDITEEKQERQQQLEKQNQQRIEQLESQEGQPRSPEEIDREIQEKMLLLQDIETQLEQAGGGAGGAGGGSPTVPSVGPDIGRIPRVETPPPAHDHGAPPAGQLELFAPRPVTFCITCESTGDALKYQSGQGSANCSLVE